MAPAPFTAPFIAALRGTLTRTSPDQVGVETLQVSANVHDVTNNHPTGTLRVVIRSHRRDGAAPAHEVVATAVSLGTSERVALYQGGLTALRAVGHEWHMEALLAPSARAENSPATDRRWLQLRLALRASADGQVSGLADGMPAPVAAASGR